MHASRVKLSGKFACGSIQVLLDIKVTMSITLGCAYYAGIQHARARTHTPLTRWKHVYSHIGVLGNERADRLANQGYLSRSGRSHFLRKQRARQGLAPVSLPA